MTVTGVVVALPGEFRALVKRGRPVPKGCVPASPEVWVVWSGIGSERAKDAAHALLAAGAQALVSWGAAGGLDPALSAGTLLLAEAVVVPGQGRYPVDLRWRASLRARLMGHVAFVEGPLASTRKVLDDPAQKAALFRATGALAADMESGAVAAVAKQRGKPFLVVRVIADTAAMAMPRRLLHEVDDWGRIRPTSLVAMTLRNPSELVRLLRLGRRYFSALRTLALVNRHLGLDGLRGPSPSVS